jgi:hypothetical protein
MSHLQPSLFEPKAVLIPSDRAGVSLADGIQPMCWRVVFAADLADATLKTDRAALQKRLGRGRDRPQ